MSHQPGDENAPRNTPEGGRTPAYGQNDPSGTSYGAHSQDTPADQGPPQYNPQNSGYDAAPSYQGQTTGYQNQYGGQPAGRPAGWGMGLAALICGIVGLVFSWAVVPGIAALVAIILGIVAIRKLKRTPGAGKAMPIIGIITGALGTIIAVIVLIFWIALGSAIVDADQNCNQYDQSSSAYQECVSDYLSN